MKKLRLLALPVMLGSLFFILGDQSVAKAEVNWCFPSGDTCAFNGNCCTRVCCHTNDPRNECTGIEPDTCL